MKQKLIPHWQRGQSLVEYALVLVLVALVAIFIVGVIGNVAQRIYGVTCGALGCKKDDQRSATLYVYFEDPPFPVQCGFSNAPAPGGGVVGTGFYAKVDIAGVPYTAVPIPASGGLFRAVFDPADLTISAGTVINGIYADNIIIQAPNQFTIQPVLAPNTNKPDLCPVSIVIQTSQKYGQMIAIRPVELYF